LRPYEGNARPSMPASSPPGRGASGRGHPSASLGCPRAHPQLVFTGPQAERLDVPDEEARAGAREAALSGTVPHPLDPPTRFHVDVVGPPRAHVVASRSPLASWPEMFASESRSAPASCRHGAPWMLPRFCVGPHIPSPESHALKVPFGPNHSPPPSFRIRRRRRHSSQHALPCSMDRASCRSTCRSEGRGNAPTTTLGCAQRPAPPRAIGSPSRRRSRRVSCDPGAAGSAASGPLPAPAPRRTCGGGREHARVW
jgi:hypothetical protein